MLFLKFEIPKDKLYEFDLAIGRLVKWPVYTLYTSNFESNKKSFEFIREWPTNEAMEHDLQSQIFTNLLGAVKVLGTLKFSKIYKSKEITNEFNLTNK